MRTFYFLFIENHRSLTAIFNSPLKKKLCLLILVVPWHQHVLQSNEGRTQWLSCPCSSITTQQKWKTQSTFWPNQLLQMANKKMQVCSFYELCWATTSSGSQVLAHRKYCDLWQGMWNKKLLWTIHKKNFFRKMHCRKKGTHLGWQMDLQISSLQDKRRKCVMQSEAKRKFLCIAGIKTAPH